jgi:hypothetical protein
VVLLKEEATKEESAFADGASASKARDADAALRELGAVMTYAARSSRWLKCCRGKGMPTDRGSGPLPSAPPILIGLWGVAAGG